MTAPRPRAAVSWSGGKDSCAALQRARASYDVVRMVTMFEEHRQWAERICESHGLTAVEPLWGSSTEALFEDWIASGSEALIVTARSTFMDESWLGRPLSRELLPEFERLGVDPCGERGEYHTVVTGSPLFSSPLRLRRHGHVRRSGCWALDLGVDDAAGA